MTELIRSIKEINEGGYGGYEITTNKQVIKLLMDDFQSCCEHFGYFMSEDDFDRFVAEELIDIQITDTALNKSKLEEYGLKPDGSYVCEGDIMFVDIYTSEGVLQFVAYNEHNGYYGHTAKIISEQLNYETCL